VGVKSSLRLAGRDQEVVLVPSRHVFSVHGKSETGLAEPAATGRARASEAPEASMHLQVHGVHGRARASEAPEAHMALV